MSNNILAITGMHRSGTSLIAQYLHKCGLSLGSNLSSNNNVGRKSSFGFHHEDMDFVDFHDMLLSRRHMSAFPSTGMKLLIPSSRTEKKKAAQLLCERDEYSVWGWKDPRTSLFLDFWKDVDSRIDFLCIFRDPLAVVDSLLRRDVDKQITQNPLIAVKAWKVYNQNLLNFCSQYPEKSLVLNADKMACYGNNAIPAIERKFSLKLNKIPFSDLFSEKAFRVRSHEENGQIALLLEKQSKLIDECKELYKVLDEISSV
jgi:O-antigen biosynthesis protein